jgi:hypothetical protein
MLSKKDIKALTEIIISDPKISKVLAGVLNNSEKDDASGLHKLTDVSTLIRLIQSKIDTMNAELDENLQPYNRVLELLNRESSSEYDEMKWRVFTTKYYDENNINKTYEGFMESTGLNKSTPVQRVELYTYYEYDPKIMTELDLQLYENMESTNDIRGFNENNFKEKFPIIRINTPGKTELLNRFQAGDNLLFMVKDGGLISKQGHNAIWDETNTSNDQTNHDLRFRYVHPFEIGTTRLLHKSNRVLNNAGHFFKHLYNTGGKTRKRSKRKSKSKTQRKSKSKSKTQRRRKSTLKKGGAKSKRRYRK